jgi:hypothetical protein
MLRVSTEGQRDENKSPWKSQGLLIPVILLPSVDGSGWTLADKPKMPLVIGQLLHGRDMKLPDGWPTAAFLTAFFGYVFLPYLFLLAHRSNKADASAVQD